MFRILTQEQEDILRNLLLRDVTVMFESIHFVLELSTYGITLSNEVITATSVNSFKNRLDLFRADQEVLYNYTANITGNRGIKL